jgi:hypothetical protein
MLELKDGSIIDKYDIDSIDLKKIFKDQVIIKAVGDGSGG